jgi:hypothetical protein
LAQTLQGPQFFLAARFAASEARDEHDLIRPAALHQISENGAPNPELAPDQLADRSQTRDLRAGSTRPTLTIKLQHRLGSHA